MCVLTRHTFCKSLLKLCVTKLKYRSFSDIGQCFRSAQTKSLENQKDAKIVGRENPTNGYSFSINKNKTGKKLFFENKRCFAATLDEKLHSL